MRKVIHLRDKDLKNWQFGRRLASLRKHFADYGSTLKRVTIEGEDTLWIYDPQEDKEK